MLSEQPLRWTLPYLFVIGSFLCPVACAELGMLYIIPIIPWDVLQDPNYAFTWLSKKEDTKQEMNIEVNNDKDKDL